MKAVLTLICIAGGIVGFLIAFAGSQSDTSPFEQSCCLGGGIALMILGVVAIVTSVRGLHHRVLIFSFILQVILLTGILIWGM